MPMRLGTVSLPPSIVVSVVPHGVCSRPVASSLPESLFLILWNRLAFGGLFGGSGSSNMPSGELSAILTSMELSNSSKSRYENPRRYGGSAAVVFVSYFANPWIPLSTPKGTLLHGDQ